MTTNDALATALGLRDVIKANREETETRRQLPKPIVEALINTKLCRMALPKALGGLETPPLEALAVYDELGAAEASVAWVAWNNSLVCWLARFMPPEIRRDVFNDPNWLYANSTRPSGRAVADSDGYSLNGRWSLVSGCMHAEWIPVAGLVEENGNVQMPRPGVPNMRMFIVPRRSFDILDTWHVGGLRGTGSHDVVLKDEHVPSERSFSFMDPRLLESPFGRVPIVATLAAGCASICLGIAREAMSALMDLGQTKKSPDPGPSLRERSQNQAMIARTSCLLSGLRANLSGRYGEAWEKVKRDEPLTAADLAPVWAAAITTALEARTAVTGIYAAAGTSALYVQSPIERAHRDIHAVLQHVILQPMWLEEAGRVAFGLEPSHPMFAI